MSFLETKKKLQDIHEKKKFFSLIITFNLIHFGMKRKIIRPQESHINFTQIASILECDTDEA